MDIQQDGKMERLFQYPDASSSASFGDPKSQMASDNVALTMVLETLRQATNQNAEILKPAEKKLQEWEVERGYYPILLNIFSNHSLEVNVRWLAVLCFKTGVDRYWRKNAPNGISDEEKEILRTGLVSNFHEPVNQLATQLAVVIAKVARFDCPREWPTLMPVLLSKVRDPNILVQQRGLLSLHHVIKTLSSKRLAGDRRLFQELSSEIYSFVLNLWNTHTEEFLQQVTNDSTNALPSLEKSLLALRILRKLTVHGPKEPHLSPDVVLFVKMVFERAKTMLECRKCMLDKGGMIEILEKVIIQLSKVLLSLLEIHPLSYVDFIEPSLQFAVFYAFTPEGQPFLFERFVVQCLNLIKMILLCAEYKLPKGNDELVASDKYRAQHITTSFFQPETLTAMCHKLVGHYFLLTPEDLQLWDLDPEHFASDEGGECWKYNLKPCTESLFLTLYNEFRSTLSPVLLELIRNNQEMVPPNDLNAILMKDAIYNAAGQAVFHLYDEVDFDQWFISSLSGELGVGGELWGHYRVLRRRIAWLLGQWSGVKLSANLRPQLYQVMLHLLKPEEDLVVRLAASKALLIIVDSVEFNVDQFLDYLESTISSLFNLLKECNECESKMYVLHVMSNIVERVGPLVRPYIPPLSQYLPFVWEESAEHEMLRCAILSTLVQLVKAMFADCKMIESFVLPVLALSTDMQQRCSVYLLEDGLALWLAYVENSAAITDSLMNVYRNMPPLFEQTEHLEMCAAITQAYTLLAPENFLKIYGQEVITKCEYLLTDLRDPGIIIIMVTYETFLRAAPELAVELIRPALPNVFLRIYECDAPSMVMWAYFTILARTLLLSKDTFVEIITALARKLNVSVEEVLAKILDTCVEKMPSESHSRRKKLLSLSLASLLTVQSRTVLERLPSILRSITETLNDIVKVNLNGTLLDVFVPECGSPQVTDSEDEDEYEAEFEPQTEHSERKLKLDRADIVHTVKLASYLQSQLSELFNQAGAQQMEEMMKTVDSETLCQLKEYGVL